MHDSYTNNRKGESAVSVMCALESFYARHADELFYFCYRRLGDVEAARDAASRVMLKAMNNLDSFRPHPERPRATFRAWVFRIARNEVIDIVRARKPTASLDRLSTDGETWRDPADPAPPPLDRALQAESEQEVAALLAYLPDSQRAIVELRLAGLSGAEIADALGLTIPAMKSAQYRAYQRLRSLLSDPERSPFR